MSRNPISGGGSFSGNLGSFDLTTTGFIGVGATPRSTIGLIRTPGGTQTLLAARNNANSANYEIVRTTTGDVVMIGEVAVITSLQFYCAGSNIHRVGSFYVQNAAGTLDRLFIDGNGIQCMQPLKGGDLYGPLKLKSQTINFTSDANLTLSSTQYSNPDTTITDTGVLLTAARDVILPDAQGGIYYVTNSTLQTLTFTDTAGGATGADLTAGQRAWIKHNGTDYELMSAPI